MLDLVDVTLQIGEEPEAQTLLKQVSLHIPSGQFVAIVGPSGCGKSTLLKVIAGLSEPTEGNVQWLERDLAEEDLAPSEIGYVPQFSIAYDFLSVQESVDAAMRLRVRGLTSDQRQQRVEDILTQVGLHEIPDRRVRVLSGGQKRRLAMAMELVSRPVLLLCDEVTSGLDPKAEQEIVDLMHQVSRRKDRIVLSVTHSLRHLVLYDSVVVLYEGCVAFHGPSQFLLHHFSVKNPEEIFPRLATRPAEDWRLSWDKRRHAYYSTRFTSGHAEEGRNPEGQKSEGKEQKAKGENEPADEANEKKSKGPGEVAPYRTKEEAQGKVEGAKEEGSAKDGTPKGSLRAALSAGAESLVKGRTPPKPPKSIGDQSESEDESDGNDHKMSEASNSEELTPGVLTQFFVLLGRRWRIFFRDRSQVWLQLVLMLGFPCLVVIFALHGLPQMANFNMENNGDILKQIMENVSVSRQATKVGSLVSGLVMFQVILLTLMGSNNSCREVAAERLIFEKEKLAGLRPISYLASKACFLFFLVAAQSVWMGVFVNLICHFPGDLLFQIVLLMLVNGAMAAVCLGISSIMRSPEQASLVSIYLVGFQLPLSGAVLALPEPLGTLTRPFIAAYWSWSGILQTMRETRFYDAVQSVTQTDLSVVAVCFWALCSHIILGFFLAYIGCRQSRWE